jgi:hypothetical protein
METKLKILTVLNSIEPARTLGTTKMSPKALIMFDFNCEQLDSCQKRYVSSLKKALKRVYGEDVKESEYLKGKYIELDAEAQKAMVQLVEVEIPFNVQKISIEEFEKISRVEKILLSWMLEIPEHLRIENSETEEPDLESLLGE